jgi:flagellar hook-associated protein 2
MTSGGFTAATDVIDANDFSIDITVNGTTETVAITGGTTVAGVVSAINAAGTGVTARLVNTGTGGTPYKIVLQGESGSDNAFSVASTSAGISFPTTLQAAQDAEFTLDGIPMTRSNNSVTDALDGITLTLNRVNATTTNLGVSYDTAGITASVERFVEAYNLVNDFIIRATGLPSADDELAGTLQGSTVTRSLRNQLRNLMGSATTASDTTTTRWAELGVEFDRSGTLTFDTSRFTTVFESNPSDAIKAMSNNLTRPNLFSGASSGLAGDLAIATYGMVRSTGALADIDSSYQTTLAAVTEKQTKLDRDIERLTARYERQFSAMDAILSRFKATSKSLESSLDFNNKD